MNKQHIVRWTDYVVTYACKLTSVDEEGILRLPRIANESIYSFYELIYHSDNASYMPKIRFVDSGNVKDEAFIINDWIVYVLNVYNLNLERTDAARAMLRKNINWCEEHLRGKYSIDERGFIFHREEDAVLFKIHIGK